MQEVSKHRSSSQQILADDLMLFSQDWNYFQNRFLGKFSRNWIKSPVENIEKHDGLFSINTIYYFFMSLAEVPLHISANL